MSVEARVWSCCKQTGLVILVFTLAGVCCAQQPAAMNAQVQLLDHLAGNWVLQGTIAGKTTTHDVQAEWVLNREYLRLHEVSREKDAAGRPSYEAIVFISWDEKAQEYACLWLDSTGGGGLSAQGIGHAKKSGDSIPFVFAIAPSVSLRTTFTFDGGTDTWKWLIDDESNGKNERFADVKLSRAK
jgi:hypothetical protein